MLTSTQGTERNQSPQGFSQTNRQLIPTNLPVIEEEQKTLPS
jgi:hypothetical protein